MGSSEPPSHRLQTSLTRATVEDSTAGLAPTRSSPYEILDLHRVHKGVFLQADHGSEKCMKRHEVDVAVLRTAAIEGGHVQLGDFPQCGQVQQGEDELALREGEAGTLRSFTNPANVGSPADGGHRSWTRTDMPFVRQLSKVSMGSRWEDVYHEHVERYLSAIYNVVEEAEWENSYHKFVEMNKEASFRNQNQIKDFAEVHDPKCTYAGSGKETDASNYW